LQKFLLALLVIPILAMGLEALLVVASGFATTEGLFFAALMIAPSLVLVWWAIAHAREQRETSTTNPEKAPMLTLDSTHAAIA